MARCGLTAPAVSGKQCRIPLHCTRISRDTPCLHLSTPAMERKRATVGVTSIRLEAHFGLQMTRSGHRRRHLPPLLDAIAGLRYIGGPDQRTGHLGA